MSATSAVRRTALAACVALAAAAAPAAGIEDLPKRKPGLWETTTLAGDANRAPVTSRVCIDAATDAALTNFALGVANQVCSKRDIRVSGGVATIDAVCTIGDSKQTVHSTISFTGDTSYRTEARAHFEPPFMGRSDASTVQEAKWVGPCPPDMKPGDLVMGDGVRINLNDIAGGNVPRPPPRR